MKFQNRNLSDNVDWHKQWELFAPNFFDGLAHINLIAYGSNKTLQLQPGPGFGDLSHPTTALMLQNMNGLVHGENVLDIGCGSGILSLAALMMGAVSAHGIDINEEALVHAQKNARLNRLDKSAFFSRSLPKKARGVLLMNMILSEQKAVLEEIPDLQKKASLWIGSGFLEEQKKDALSFASNLGFSLLEEKKKDGWLGLIFRRN